MKISEPSDLEKKRIKIISSIMALVVIVLVVKFKDQIHLFSQWGYIGIFVVSAIGNATIFMPLPILITIGAMGISLNPFLVGASASLGAAVGESVGYFLGMAGNIVVQKSKKYQEAKEVIQKYGAWGIFGLSSFPNPLFDIAGILAGATGIKYHHFFFATWAGTYIKFTLISAIGYQFFFTS